MWSLELAAKSDSKINQPESIGSLKYFQPQPSIFVSFSQLSLCFSELMVVSYVADDCCYFLV